MKGPDLTAIFLAELKKIGVDIRDTVLRSGKVVYARIASKRCYLRHANLSRVGDYSFGFAKKDIDKNDMVKETRKVILLCGPGELKKDIFVMDFDGFISLIREGSPVGKNRADYEEYQAKIFPNRNYEMTVTHRQRDPIDMNVFRTSILDIVNKLSS